MNTAYLSAGSNIGDRLKTIKDALHHLAAYEGIKISAVSAVYETKPVGYEEQDDFLNIAIKLETSLSPFELLETCQGVERELGRKRDIRWGPRTIDLDILLYNSDSIVSEHLTIPHPRMWERGFVLAPLCDIAPDIIHPATGRRISETTDWQGEGVYQLPIHEELL